eukprot:s5639_g4.t1
MSKVMVGLARAEMKRLAECETGPAVPTWIWGSRLESGSAHWDPGLAVEVRQCPLRSGTRGWGLAVPAAIWDSPLRSGSAHWDLELADEVRQCPLRSGAGEEREEKEKKEDAGSSDKI